VAGNVFVNGTFDVLHPGHMALLNYESSLGSKLFVAIDNDERVKELKGDDRPVNDAHTRRIMLESTKWVDEVIIFSSDIELDLIVRQIRPKHMVVGGDYKDKQVIGSRWAKNLHFFDRIDGYSSTKIIQRIADRR
jgi:rfaE bifunctional protein nucleotidyltransferase chain/domain